MPGIGLAVHEPGIHSSHEKIIRLFPARLRGGIHRHRLRKKARTAEDVRRADQHAGASEVSNPDPRFQKRLQSARLSFARLFFSDAACDFPMQLALGIFRQSDTVAP